MAEPISTQLSIAIPNYNGLAVLPATLEALEKLGEPNLQILMVDDGSTDGSPDWVRTHHPGVRIISMGENTRSANKVRNRALREATTPFVMLIDNDILLDRASLQELFRVVTSRDDILGCTPRLLYHPEPPDTIYADGGRMHYLGFGGNFKRGLPAKDYPPDPPRPTLGSGIMMVNRPLAASIGYIDENYPIGASDVEFHIRGRLHGLQVLHVSTATALHVERPHGKDRAYAQVYNRYRMITCFYSARTLLLLSPALVMFEILLTFMLASRGMLKERFRALSLIWKDRHKLLEIRKRLQGCRRISDAEYLEGDEMVPMGSAARSRLIVIGSRLLNPIFRGYWRLVRRALLTGSSGVPPVATTGDKTDTRIPPERAVNTEMPSQPAGPNQINVLYIAFTSGPARAANRLQSIRVCYFMARVGLRVHLHLASSFFRDRKQLLEYFGFDEEPNFKLYLYPVRHLGGLEKLHPFCWYLKRLLAMIVTGESRKYDVFFARGRFPAMNILLKPLLGHKVLFEFHEIMYLSTVPERELPRTKRLLDVERFIFRRADAVIAISRTLLDFAEQRWSRRDTTTVIPSGAVTFESEPLPDNRPIRHLFFVGNFYPYSGIDYLVRALPLVPEVTLTIVGCGGEEHPERRRVSGLVEQLGLGERVKFLGYVEPHRLPSVYAGADAVVMPEANTVMRKYFASPLKLFEYMSTRRPIIATGHPTIREILTDGHNALLTEPENPQSIAGAIRRLISDPELGRRLAEQAYKDVEQYAMRNKCAAIAEFIRHRVVASQEAAAYCPKTAKAG